MAIALGIVLIVIGLVAMTAHGARASMRYNDAHPHQSPNSYSPKTVTGTRVLGLLILIGGIAVLATSL